MFQSLKLLDMTKYDWEEVREGAEEGSRSFTREYVNPLSGEAEGQ